MNLKTNRKTKFLTLFLSITLLSCEKDFKDDETTNLTTNPNVKTYFINGNQARAVASKLSKQYGKTLSNQNTTFRTDNGIIVDYESIMVVENNIEDVAYSFKVDTNQENETTFQNLALVEKNGLTQTKLITYEMTPEFANLYHADLKDISQFEGNITILDLSENNCCGQNSITIPISGGGGSGSYDDGIGSGGSYGDNGGSSGGWGIGFSSGSGSSGGQGQQVQMCRSGQHVRGNPRCIYTPKESGPNNPILSNRMSSPNQNTAIGDPRDLCCIFDIGIYEEALFKNDCDKLKKATQDNPSMITDLINLEAKTSEPIEHGIYKTSGSVTTQTAIAGQNGSVEFPNITTEKYEVVAHTHNSPANSTYSIFSWEDLESVYNMIKADKVNTSKFVSFLSTADGTRYAFTISDLRKFEKAFAKEGDPQYSLATDIKKEVERIKNYLGDSLNNLQPIIKENNNNPLEDEKAFLKMLQKLNCGISLFEVDATYTNFEKVELDNSGNKTNQPCVN